MDGPGKDTRMNFGARCAAVLAVCAIGALGAAGPAAAETGGASTAAAAEAETGGGIAFSALQSAGATWYGPGFYGKRTACGQVLRPGTLGVAHRNLPCGTAVKFVYRGRQIVTRVIDRGPYSKGFSWDLTNGAREALGFEGSGQVRYAVALSLARR
jgi:rare lipoprotein A (peptidoglycan hydrolase)